MSRILLLLATASGVSALIYQIVWLRRLVLVFGSTTLATSTVLASFLGGLAIGAWVWGRVADRTPSRGIRLFGLVEAATGAYGLASLPLLEGVERVYLAAAPGLERLPGLSTAMQLALCAAVIAPAAVLMGGTVPLLARAIGGERQVVGGVGRLYGWNTLGAALGAGLATYGLLPAVGLRGSIVLAAAGNLAIAVAALHVGARRLSAPTGGRAPSHPASNEQREEVEVSPDVQPLVVLQGIALSGLAAMTYEVAWARLMALVLGSSVYAFGTLVIVLLAGLGLGSWLYARLRIPENAHLWAFGILQAGIGLTAAASLVIAPQLPFLYMSAFPSIRSDFASQVAVQITLVSLAVFVPALLMGATFPAAVGSLRGGARGIGRTVGRVYAWNTVGTVVGAYLAGFVLVSAFGLRATIVVGVLANLVAAAGIVFAVHQRSRRLSVMAPAAAALVIILMLPAWPREVFAAGAGYFAANYGSLAALAKAVEEMQLLYYRDGINTTISVDEIGEERVYRSNGKTDASTFPLDMATQMLLGHVPMLWHPAAADVFVLGLGTGVTAAAVARYPVRRIDLVEFEPAAVEASRFFERFNRGVVEDPRLRLLLTDGRNRLLASPTRYDVVISDASDLWVAGIGSLFTLEFYQTVRERLRPGGVLVQWVHTHALPPSALELLVSTFHTAFPQASVWSSGYANVMLVGWTGPVPLPYDRVVRRMADIPGVAEDLRTIGIWHPAALLAAFVTGPEGIGQLSGAGGVHTDDRPVLEFATPRWLYTDTTEAIENTLERVRASSPPPVAASDRARIVGDADATYLIGFAHAALGRPQTGIPFMERSTKMDPRRPVFAVGLANQYRAVGRTAHAKAEYQRAIALDPRQVEARVALGEMLLESGQAPDALALAEAALAIAPRDARARALAVRAKAGPK